MKSEKLATPDRRYPIANVLLGILRLGEPFGLAFFAGCFLEGLLLRAMSAFEKIYTRTLPECCSKDVAWLEICNVQQDKQVGLST